MKSVSHKTLLFFLVFPLVKLSFLHAQNPPQITTYDLKPAIDPIVLDGIPDEESWQRADIATDFYMNIPFDDRSATQETEVRMTYDQQNLYFSIICFTDDEGFIVQSLRRDFDWGDNENFSIYFDPYNDFTNGFSFGITPFGVQREGTISEGVNVDTNWDSKWYSEVKVYKGKWVAEIAIPFKSIRYGDDNRVWNVQFYRNHLKRNERSSWIAVEQQYRASSFAFSGKILWPEPPPPTGTNISIIPYVLGNFNKDYQNTESKDGAGGNIGFDAKIGVTQALNLDLTVNPDFSQVEADRQVINLSRFEISFPERRQFFLENADLFSKFGFPRSRAFFSRRIGITTDTLGRTQQIPVLGGARLSGKVGERLRVGLLNSLTDKDENLGTPYQNYTVLALQQNVFKRSNISFILANKQNLGVDQSADAGVYNPQVSRREIQGNDTTVSYKLYNRVVGLEYNLFTEDTRWEGDFYYQHSFDEWNKENAYNHGAFLRYQQRNFAIRWAHTAIGDGFNAEMGFVPRVGYNQGSFSPSYIMYPDHEAIINHQLSFDISYTTDAAFEKITDNSIGLQHQIIFTNTSYLFAEIERNYQYMFFNFNPISPKGDSLLLEDTDYNWNSGRLFFRSDRKKLITYDAGMRYGGFYNGKLFNVSGNISYRFQPYGSFSVDLNYNDIRLPEGFGEAKFYLIGPRLDITFTDAVFFTGFAQYNNRFDNVNYNLRFQWRFAPASDLFLVYTENFAPNGQVDFLPGNNTKNRALVLKINYWLNL